jgi:hypothetical protein
VLVNPEAEASSEFPNNVWKLMTQREQANSQILVWEFTSHLLYFCPGNTPFCYSIAVFRHLRHILEIIKEVEDMGHELVHTQLWSIPKVKASHSSITLHKCIETLQKSVDCTMYEETKLERRKIERERHTVARE